MFPWSSRRRLPREEVRRYVKTTPFSSGEIWRLWRRFSHLDADNSGFLLITEMLKVDELRCNPFAARIVELFSEDGSGEIDFQKFINIFSVFSSRATVDTKMVWAFAIWDFDGDDLIGPRDIKRGVHLLTNAEIAILNTDHDEPPEEDELPEEQSPTAGTTLARAPMRRRRKRRDSAAVRGEKLSEEQMTQVHERVAHEIDPEGTGVSFPNFETIARRMPDFFLNFRMSV